MAMQMVCAMGCAMPIAAHAASLQLCAGPDVLGVAEKDRLFRFGAVVKQELQASGRSLALIARSGLDLQRFGVRYSHAGFSLQASDNTPWSVRQLYYACDEGLPHLYDQGISGFVLGTDEPGVGYVSLVFLPQAQGLAVERAVLDRPRALQVLGARYSANAYPFSAQYQNCNQWVLELLASAWAPLEGDRNDDGPSSGSGARAAAQAWLRDRGYEPSTFDVGWRPLMWVGNLLPWLHSDDHPDADLEQARYRVSMPAAIEAFVHAQAPGASRIEICHDTHRVVVHRGWDSIAEGCVPGVGDTVIALD